MDKLDKEKQMTFNQIDFNFQEGMSGQKEEDQYNTDNRKRGKNLYTHKYTLKN